MLSSLRSAATQPTITRFVPTLSSIAGDYARLNEVHSIGENFYHNLHISFATEMLTTSPVLSPPSESAELDHEEVGLGWSGA